MVARSRLTSEALRSSEENLQHAVRSHMHSCVLLNFEAGQWPVFLFKSEKRSKVCSVGLGVSSQGQSYGVSDTCASGVSGNRRFSGALLSTSNDDPVL
jgi:hypothetical protein